MENKILLISVILILFSVLFLTNTNFVIAPHGSNCTAAADCYSIGYKCEGGLCVEPTQSECTAAGGCWSAGYCSNPPCASTTTTNTTTTPGPNAPSNETTTTPPPTGGICTSSQLWNCYNQGDCALFGGYWCTYSGGYASCQSSACPVCSSSQTWNCYTQTECTGAKGYWCNNYCSSYSCPVCSSSQAWNCYTQTECTGAGAQWCGTYCSSSCPVCSSSQAWNCYTQTECTGAGAQWCGTYCSSSCPVCSSSQYGNCNDQTSCTGAGAQWCTGTGTYSYCSSSCPVCSSSQLWSCYDSASCTGAGGSWCKTNYGTTYCQSGTCPTYTCSITEPWYCNDKTSCTNAGASWCNNYCQSSQCPTCSKGTPWYCYTSSECSAVGKSWCESYGKGYCTDSCPTCSSSQKWNCDTETKCKTAGGNWCSNYCSDYSCPTCSSSQPWNCNDKTSCTGAGNEWCGLTSTGATNTTYAYTPSGWCSDKCPRCEAGKTWNCNDENSCKTAGGDWCGTYCSSQCPICSKDSPWYCNSQGECGSVGASWCGTYCSSSCPTCSKDSPWNCYTESDCTSIASATWCKISYGSSYCQLGTCPTCSKESPWNCYDKSSCEGTGANWCESSYESSYVGKGSYSWCDSYECPVCKQGQAYNCYDQSSCTNAGGNWCTGYGGNYCSDYGCPAICGDGICDTGETYSCNTDCPKTTSCPAKIDASLNNYNLNVGDLIFLRIEVSNEQGSPIPYIELELRLSPPDVEGTVSTDSNGEFIYNGSVTDDFAAGKIELSITTNVPDCKDISTTLKFNVNSRGYCGDGICSNEENFESCPWDCGEAYCPETRTCPQGDFSRCKSSGAGCFCESCNLDPNKLPPGCEQVKNPKTGMVSVKCPQTCPPPPNNINKLKETCINNDGNPVLRTDSLGCNYFECSFVEDPSLHAGYDKCFTKAEISSTKVKCEKLGLPLKIINVGEDCEIARCEQPKTIADDCPDISLSERNEIKTKCSLEGLEVITSFGENGCPVLTCGSSNDCIKELPDNAYTQCSELGGEVAVRSDVNDCIIFAECLKRGDERDISVDIDEIPSTDELLKIVLGIESILVKMDEISSKLGEISDYYRSTGSDDYKRFEAAKNSLNSMIEKIKSAKDGLKDKIENKQVTITDVRELFYNIEYTVEVGLEDVLWKLLSIEHVETTVETGNLSVKDCGSDNSCFEDAFAICQPATFNSPQGTDGAYLYAEIKEVNENGECVIEARIELPKGATLPEGSVPEGIEPPYAMTCKTPKYSLGLSDAERTLFAYCEGSLAKIFSYTTNAPTTTESGNVSNSTLITASVIAFLENNKGPGDCAGDSECMIYCKRNPIGCLTYLNYKINTNSGPGGTRSISAMVSYCDSNEQECGNWFSSRGVELPEIESKKRNIKYTITGKAIRR